MYNSQVPPNPAVLGLAVTNEIKLRQFLEFHDHVALFVDEIDMNSSINQTLAEVLGAYAATTRPEESAKQLADVTQNMAFLMGFLSKFSLLYSRYRILFEPDTIPSPRKRA